MRLIYNNLTRTNHILHSINIYLEKKLDENKTISDLHLFYSSFTRQFPQTVLVRKIE